MEFRIADTFTDSLAKLTGDEQKAVKTTAFDLQLNPVNPGMSFHKLDKAKDKNFWSLRVSSDIRLIVHKTNASLLLCYVDHHDKAYEWATRRKLETHPKTGAAQLVEIREIVREQFVPRPGLHLVAESQPQYLDAGADKKSSLFSDVPDEALLNYGVPSEWLAEARKANEDTLLELARHLPGEAAEALLELATGGTPRTPLPLQPGADPFTHPDAQRRFRVMSNVEELERALEFPWEKWAVFLHPEQRQWVERDYSGPARVSGSAGTGKTIVALHRAVYLARQYPEARILLATFSGTLANALRTKLRHLISNQPQLAERLEVHAVDALGERLYEFQFGRPQLATSETIELLLAQASHQIGGHKFSPHFLFSEWRDVVDAWQLQSWEDYRDVRRLGRKTRLPEMQRSILWGIFDSVRMALKARGLITRSGMFALLTDQLVTRKHPPFDFAVVDEAQDVSVAQLRFFAALGAGQPNALFFAGDLGQRIFQQPFSWKALGVDIRGRARTLHVNYRTSHQIRLQADRLLGAEVADVDGNVEERRGTVSVFNGPLPTVEALENEQDEIAFVSAWLVERSQEGVVPNEIGVFVRSEKELERARQAVNHAGLRFRVLDDQVEISDGQISIGTMHLAKGLEFRAVVVMACDDEIIPLQARIESVVDESDLEEIYNTERHLLYVACTRARDYLLVTSAGDASEFLDDLLASKSLSDTSFSR